MPKKDIVTGAEAVYVPFPIGETIYLWKRQDVSNDAVVITAHGGESTSKRTKPPAGVQLYYYCPDTYACIDPGVTGIITGLVKYYEAKPGGEETKDYGLGKFQGKHGGAKTKEGEETYRDFQVKVHPDFRRDIVEKFFTGQFKVDALAQIRPVTMDIVSVRNRRFHRDPTLWEVIEALQKAGHDYKHVHCSFCRVPAKGKWESWSTSQNKGDEGIMRPRLVRSARVR
jgi:hypothetical protein